MWFSSSTGPLRTHQVQVQHAACTAFLSGEVPRGILSALHATMRGSIVNMNIVPIVTHVPTSILEVLVDRLATACRRTREP
jgi:hypothetical protein